MNEYRAEAILKRTQHLLILHRAYKLLTMDAEWDESKHPRAENGQFGGGSREKQTGKPSKGKTDLGSLFQTAISNSGGNAVYSDFAIIDGKTAGIVKAETGIDISGWKHSIGEADIRHILKKHGNEKTENSRGQLHGRYPNGRDSGWVESDGYKAGMGTGIDGTDLAYQVLSRFCPFNIQEGNIYYDIPIEWKLNGQQSVHQLVILRQSGEISKSGHVTVKKGNETVTFHYLEPTINHSIIIGGGINPKFRSTC